MASQKVNESIVEKVIVGVIASLIAGFVAKKINDARNAKAQEAVI